MRLSNDGCRKIYCIFLDTLEKWQMGEERRREFEGRVTAASRRGIANWVVPIVGKRRENSGEYSMVLNVFVHATSAAAATAAEKRGSRLVGVVHHRVNWRCSGHSVNPGRSITAKRSRCSSSKRASLPPALPSSSSPGSYFSGGRGATPFDFPKRRRRATTAHRSRMDARGQGV